MPIPMRSLAASALLLVALAAGCGHPGARTSAKPDPVAPDSFVVAIETSRGPLIVAAHRSWAPLGVDRFYLLVRKHYYDGARVFRVVPGFVTQFGLAADPKRTAAFKKLMIPDDPPQQSNARGTVSFASSGAGTRTAQLFINLADNARLDRDYPPIARIVQGAEAVDQFTAEYNGRMPGGVQESITREGNAYLLRAFPRLDYIKSMKVVKEWRR